MTVYAHVINGELQGVYDLIPERWNGIDDFRSKCLANLTFMNQNNFHRIVRESTPYDANTHKYSDWPTYTVENGQVLEHREIILIPQPPPEEQPPQ